MLLLDGPRKRRFGTWVGQVTRFYTQLLGTPTYLARVDRVGLRQAALEEHQGLVNVVQRIKLQCERSKGDAKQRRRERDDALSELDQWAMALRAVAEVALADKPALLTKLTLPEPGATPKMVLSSETLPEPPVYMAQPGAE